MMTQARPLQSLALPLMLLFTLVAQPAAAAAPKADQVLPATTVGYASIANVPRLRDQWNETQLGHLAADASMKPFVDQVRNNLSRKMGDLEERLGVTLDELFDVASGELALAVVPNADEEGQSSIALLVDCSKNRNEAGQLISRVVAKLEERGAKLAKQSPEGITLYDVPEGKTLGAHQAAYAFRDDALYLADSDWLIATLVEQNSTASLSTNDNYQKTLAKARKSAAGMPADISWFMVPFALDAALETRDRPVDSVALPDKKRVMQTLREEGFDGVQGIGGQVAVAPDAARDFVHYTNLYVPHKPGTEGKSAAERYDGALRMFDLANQPAGADAVQSWVPRAVASYRTMNIDILNAFDHVESLFDAMAGYENAFQTMLGGFERDPYGPMISLRDDIVAHLGSRVTIVTDYTLPITAECERYLIVIEGCNEASLREPFDKLLKNDDAKLREVEGIAYWEIVPEEPVDNLDAALLPLDDSYEEEQPERVLQRAAVCLHEGRLVIGSDVEFLRQALFGIEDRLSLTGQHDLAATMEQVNRLAPGPRSAWSFTRLDESLRPSYELIRQGKMPESQTFFGRFLNRLLTTDEEEEADALREQRIRGERLPSFELARRYFGPSARLVRSDDDGWIITGVILNKASTR